MAILMLLTHAAGDGCCGFACAASRRRCPKQENPTQLKSAIVFGLMYAVVLLALAVAQHYLATAEGCTPWRSSPA